MRLLLRDNVLGFLRQKVLRRPTLALVEVEHLAGVRDETGHSRSRGGVRGRQIYASILHIFVRKGAEVAIDEETFTNDMRKRH